MDYFLSSSLALASYANLPPGIVESNSLVGKGMSAPLADEISANWIVQSSIKSLLSGLSATVFGNKSTGQVVLAIRGTDDPQDLVTDAISISILGTYRYQLQYIQLRDWVLQLSRDGVLPASYEVVGHSLGGFLAAAITSSFPQSVSHAYLFNAPGFGGLQFDNLLGAGERFRLYGGIDFSKVSNIRAYAGISPVSGLGFAASRPVFIFVENQLDLAAFLNRPLVAFNHSQEILVDSLALYDLLTEADPEFTTESFNAWMLRSSSRNASSLESALDAFGRVLGLQLSTDIGSKDEYHQNIAVVEAALADRQFKLRLVDNPSEALVIARSDTVEGLAYRYALKTLDPFVLIRPVESYGNAERDMLTMFNPRSGMGSLTEQWLADRAEMLAVKNRQFERDLQSDLLAAGEFRVTNSRDGRSSQVFFGGLGADQLRAADGDAHLYGDAGDDLLVAGVGNDYLEGGFGFDRYLLQGSADHLLRDVVLDVDGIGEIVLDGVVLSGGRKLGAGFYQSDDGNVRYAFRSTVGGSGSLMVNGDVEIRNFHNGALGITFDGFDESSSGGAVVESGQAEFHYRESDYPVDGPVDPLFWNGSDYADQYEAGEYLADGTFVPGASAGSFMGRAGNDVYLGSYRFGADYADGGVGDDLLDAGALGDHEVLAGEPGDQLIGGEGSDRLFGGYLDDRLWGDFESVFGRHVDDLNSTSLIIGLGDGVVVFDENSGMYLQRPSQSGIRPGSYFATPQEAVEAALQVHDESQALTAYDDLIVGGAGNDTLVGGNGSDSLAGDEGDDFLLGDNDMFFYQALSGREDEENGLGEFRVLLGRPGNDVLDGGDGNDQLSDLFFGSDTFYGGEGDDILINKDGINRQLFSYIEEWIGGVDNELYGGPGNDFIQSLIGDDIAGFSYIDGGEGDDEVDFAGPRGWIVGGPGNDVISAVAGDITIDGGEDDDYIEVAGASWAYLKGGGGVDTYTLSNVRIATIELVVGEGGGAPAGELIRDDWAAVDVLAERSGDDLVLRNPVLDQALNLVDWFSAGVQRLEALLIGGVVIPGMAVDDLVGGELMGRPEGKLLLAAGGHDPLIGTDAADVLVGEGLAVLAGAGGNDRLIARGGGWLMGGRGDDSIEAAGDAIVVFNRGDGADRVDMVAGTISLGGGLTYSALSLSYGEDTLSLDFGAGDSLTISLHMEAIDEEIEHWVPPDARLQFVYEDRIDIYSLREMDGVPESRSDRAIGGEATLVVGRNPDGWSDRRLEVNFTGNFATIPEAVITNSPPQPAGALQTITLQAAEAFQYEIQQNAFSDPDGDELRYTVGSTEDWPNWLAFDAETGVLSGAPLAADVGQYEIQVYAVDPSGEWALSELRFDVHAANPSGGVSLPSDGASGSLPDTPADDPAATNDADFQGAGQDGHEDGPGGDEPETTVDGGDTSGDTATATGTSDASDNDPPTPDQDTGPVPADTPGGLEPGQDVGASGAGTPGVEVVQEGDTSAPIADQTQDAMGASSSEGDPEVETEQHASSGAAGDTSGGAPDTGQEELVEELPEVIPEDADPDDLDAAINAGEALPSDGSQEGGQEAGSISPSDLLPNPDAMAGGSESVQPGEPIEDLPGVGAGNPDGEHGVEVAPDIDDTLMGGTAGEPLQTGPADQDGMVSPLPSGGAAVPEDVQGGLEAPADIEAVLDAGPGSEQSAGVGDNEIHSSSGDHADAGSISEAVPGQDALAVSSVSDSDPGDGAEVAVGENTDTSVGPLVHLLPEPARIEASDAQPSQLSGVQDAPASVPDTYLPASGLVNGDLNDEEAAADVAVEEVPAVVSIDAGDAAGQGANSEVFPVEPAEVSQPATSVLAEPDLVVSGASSGGNADPVGEIAGTDAATGADLSGEAAAEVTNDPADAPQSASPVAAEPDSVVAGASSGGNAVPVGEIFGTDAATGADVSGEAAAEVTNDPADAPSPEVPVAAEPALVVAGVPSGGNAVSEGEFAGTDSLSVADASGSAAVDVTPSIGQPGDQAPDGTQVPEPIASGPIQSVDHEDDQDGLSGGLPAHEEDFATAGTSDGQLSDAPSLAAGVKPIEEEQAASSGKMEDDDGIEISLPPSGGMPTSSGQDNAIVAGSGGTGTAESETAQSEASAGTVHDAVGESDEERGNRAGDVMADKPGQDAGPDLSASPGSGLHGQILDIDESGGTGSAGVTGTEADADRHDLTAQADASPAAPQSTPDSTGNLLGGAAVDNQLGGSAGEGIQVLAPVASAVTDTSVGDQENDEGRPGSPDSQPVETVASGQAGEPDQPMGSAPTFDEGVDLTVGLDAAPPNTGGAVAAEEPASQGAAELAGRDTGSSIGEPGVAEASAFGAPMAPGEGIENNADSAAQSAAAVPSVAIGTEDGHGGEDQDGAVASAAPPPALQQVPEESASDTREPQAAISSPAAEVEPVAMIGPSAMSGMQGIADAPQWGLPPASPVGSTSLTSLESPSAAVGRSLSAALPEAPMDILRGSRRASDDTSSANTFDIDDGRQSSRRSEDWPVAEVGQLPAPLAAAVDLAEAATLSSGAYASIPTSWDLTRAILEFHLSDSRYSTLDGVPEQNPGLPLPDSMAFAGMLNAGMAPDQPAMPGMQVFSGLREGLSVLGSL